MCHQEVFQEYESMGNISRLIAWNRLCHKHTKIIAPSSKQTEVDVAKLFGKYQYGEKVKIREKLWVAELLKEDEKRKKVSAQHIRQCPTHQTVWTTDGGETKI